MSRQVLASTVIHCDGCGWAQIECHINDVDTAIGQCGWISREWNGQQQELCPVCRPDGPYDAVEAVQQLREWCERGHYAPDNLSEWQRGFLTARREVRAILDEDRFVEPPFLP